MSNGKEMLSDMEFEQWMKVLGDDQVELTKFIARQTFESQKRLVALDTKVEEISKRSWVNRIALIVLIFVLASLGIINTNLLPLSLPGL